MVDNALVVGVVDGAVVVEAVVIASLSSKEVDENLCKILFSW